ncbi:hypothetical protein C1645_830579 [Glomus cerebriforme]|uniref:Uncharacterized protein n=1 Tax=Glomus cerebriforme TaxID=658196 RepID=A0A397SNE4_9GLOM|nr:hypothetical protein C1645_830579 [Glomus cerebriforme]
MSALVLQNNALWHIFEDFTVSILLSACFLIYAIRNNNELNKKLTREITKINSHDTSYASEAQKIFSMVNNITTKVVQRSDFDQQSVSNESEANSTNESETNLRDSSSNSSPSSSSGSSNLSGILDITSDIKICFKQHFD